MKFKLKRKELKMKITPEKAAFFYLYDKGFTEKEIEYIKNSSEKEGVQFCIKTFAHEDLDEVKQELREHLRKKNIIKYVEKIYNIYSKKINEY